MPNGQTLLLFVTAIFSGGLFPFVSAVFKNRGEIRNLDTDSDSKTVTAAGVVMERLEKEVVRGGDRVTNLEVQLNEERVAHTRQMNRAHAEINRLGAEVATLRTNLTISNQQIEQLSTRLNAQEA
jgi:predicted  nucleic acid-binding Zn-ribbon protein